jgi:translation initiation factor IF-3
LRERINSQIRAPEIRLLDAEGENLGIFPLAEAMSMAAAQGVDLIEVNAMSRPVIGKLMDFGKYQYEQKKKAQKARTGTKTTETKSLQIKIGTGDHDLELKAKTASK